MNNSTLQINNLNHEDSGFYLCNASNELVIGSYKRTLNVVGKNMKYFLNLSYFVFCCVVIDVNCI